MVGCKKVHRIFVFFAKKMGSFGYLVGFILFGLHRFV